MPIFTIETTYRLPVFRQRRYEAETLEDACRRALADDDWSGQKEDHDSSGDTHVTGIWAGDVEPYSIPTLAIPVRFAESLQRRAGHYEVLLGLLKIVTADGAASDPWRGRVAAAIAEAEAILAGEPGPIDRAPAVHILALFDDAQVRENLADVIETHPMFAGLSPADISDQDIRAACHVVTAAVDLTEEIGAAAFRAALIAVSAAQERRVTPSKSERPTGRG